MSRPNSHQRRAAKTRERLDALLSALAALEQEMRSPGQVPPSINDETWNAGWYAAKQMIANRLSALCASHKAEQET